MSTFERPPRLPRQAPRPPRSFADGLTVADAERAFDTDELQLWLQPVVDVRDGTVVGLEGLARWEHPTLGRLAPGDFLPLINAAGLDGRLDRWALTAGVKVARQLADRRDHPPRVWLNLSASSLESDRLPRSVGDLLREHDLHGGAIGLEVTEQAVLDDFDTAARVLGVLRAMAVETALDDFGTGYSSLARLRRLPLHTLKIDRSFVAGISTSVSDAAIVSAVVDLSHGFGMRVVAEGVEQIEQLETLIELGVDRVQGFYLARPEPIDDILTLVGSRWCGVPAPTGPDAFADHRLDDVAGTAGVRGRLMLTALDSTPDPVMLTTLLAPRRTVYVNAAFRVLTGYTVDDLELNPAATLAPELTAEQKAQYAATVARGDAVETFIDLRASDGAVIPVRCRTTPVRDDRGQATHLMFSFRDRRVEVAAAARERYQRELLEIVWAADQDSVDHGPGVFLERAHVTLSRLGTALGVQRAWIDVLEEGCLVELAGWSADEPDRTTPLAPVPIAAVPVWMGVLRALEPFSADGVTSTAADFSDVPHDGEWPSGALIGAPLSVGDELLGVLAFADSRAPHRWSPTEVGVVRTLAGTVANAVRWRLVPPVFGAAGRGRPGR